MGEFGGRNGKERNYVIIISENKNYYKNYIVIPKSRNYTHAKHLLGFAFLGIRLLVFKIRVLYIIIDNLIAFIK